VRGWYVWWPKAGGEGAPVRSVGRWRWRLTASTSRKKPKGNHKLKLMTPAGGAGCPANGWGERGGLTGRNGGKSETTDKCWKARQKPIRTARTTMPERTKNNNNNNNNNNNSSSSSSSTTKTKKRQKKLSSGRDLPLTVFLCYCWKLILLLAISLRFSLHRSSVQRTRARKAYRW